MKLEECINEITTFIDLKRVASAYVIDYRKLSEADLRSAVVKTGPQYYHRENVQQAVNNIILNDSRDNRVICDIILHIILNKDGFMELQDKLEEEVIAYEQNIVDIANEFDEKSIDQKLSLFQFVLEAAWEHNDNISVDEKNLLEKIRVKLKITNQEYQIIEAKIGKFPNNNNVLHTRTNIADGRKYLQSVGLLFPIRDGKGKNYDVIPYEIVKELRSIYGIEIKEYAYRQLLSSKFLKDKNYLLMILEKAGQASPSYLTIPQLQERIIKYVKPTNLLGGFSPRDGFDTTLLSKWCTQLNITSYGTKADLINNILSFYDEIKQINVESKDDRALYFEVFEQLAARNLPFLRKQQIIDKDLDCEHKFEEATNYIFERILKNKPLLLRGTDHPDGILSYNDKFILWDNKSKETAVNLADHIKQFDRYITTSEKPVAVFMVIAPAFTPDSVKECMKYSLNSDTLILLITATELKEVALEWQTKHGEDESAFPLGYFKQNGRFDSTLVTI